MRATKWLKLAIRVRPYSKFFSRFLIILLRLIFSFDVCVKEQTKIGSNVVFKHNGLGCVVHFRTTIEDNCWIYQNVTIGANTKYSNGKITNVGAPKIERGTVIYSGAVVVGPITIGENSVIGANCVINRDVPPNSIVYGNPAIIKPRNLAVSYITPSNYRVKGGD